ncbi:MAG: hypothetical protein P8I83_02235 [Paracoccaceae bacterium]|mgnify:FL=1|nr:hypothetical protein [Paracoccaceae bacterium]
MPRLTYKKSLSLGEAISSVCFFGVGVIWLSEGIDFFVLDQFLRASGLFLCATLSFAACLRYVIQNFLFKLLVGFDIHETEN